MRVEERNNQISHKRRRRKRRKLSKFSYFLILLLIFLCAVAVCVAFFCKIDKIEVVGKTQYSSEEIVKASQIKKGSNLFLVKKDIASKNIETKLPYATDVKVSYKLLDKIQISLSPAKSEYVIKNKDNCTILDKDLKILELKADLKKADKLIVISGCQLKDSVEGEKISTEKKEQIENIKMLTDELKNQKIADITAINVGDGFELSVVFQNRITILLGTNYNLSDKLSHALEIVKNHLQEQDNGTLDVSTQDRKYIFTPSVG